MSVDVFGRHLSRGAIKRGSTGAQSKPSEEFNKVLNADVRRTIQSIVKNEIEPFQTATTVLSTTSDENIKQVKELKEIVSSLGNENKEIIKMQTITKSLAETCNILSSNLMKNFDEYLHRIEVLEKISASREGLAEKLSRLEINFTGLAEDFKVKIGKLRVLIGAVAKENNRDTIDMEEWVRRINHGYAEVQKRIDLLDTWKNDEIVTFKTDISDRVDTLGETIDDNDSNAIAVEKRVKDLEEKMKKVWKP